jgi:hypothetical protein
MMDKWTCQMMDVHECPKDCPYFRGGQGRSAKEIGDIVSSWLVVLCCAAVFAVLSICAVFLISSLF